MITKRAATTEPESHLQKFHAKELNDRLDHPAADAEAPGAKPLLIKDEALLDAVKRISHEFELPIAVDAKAMQARTLDPKTKVSGSVDPKDLRKSLVKLLEPVDLTFEVRQEAIVVTPKGK